jgi:WYL_2, Sm-like SH3 beta-barrel fold
MNTGTNLYQSLRADLKKILLENVVDVTFTKKDGTLRTMQCTLMSQYLPVIEKQEDNEAKTKKQSEESIAVWDLDKKAWRSFRIDSIISHSVSSL